MSLGQVLLFAAPMFQVGPMGCGASTPQLSRSSRFSTSVDRRAKVLELFDACDDNKVRTLMAAWVELSPLPSALNGWPPFRWVAILLSHHRTIISS